MSEKYYIPELEELCIGLECEINQSKINPKFEWEKYTVGQGYENITINRAISEIVLGGIRVKYLDQSDIEECGFKYDNDSDTFKLWYTYEMYELDKNNETINISRFYQNKLCAKVLPFSEWSEFNIFNGEIKNKTEFEKLLTQLGIK